MFRIVFHNLAIKILCIAGAALLWFYVSLTQSSIAKFPGTITIKPINIATGYAAVFDQKSVEIKVMADAVDWKLLSSESFTAYVDLSNAKEGTFEIPVSVTSSVPGVSIVEKKPEKVLVSVESVVTREVELSKRIEGNAADGFTAGETATTPEKVEVRGAKSAVDSVTDAVIILNLNGEKEQFEKNYLVHLFNGKDELNNLEIIPHEVSAKTTIIKSSNNKSVGVRVKTINQPKTGFYVSDISVDPSTIDIIGNQQRVSELKFVESSPIDLSGKFENFEQESTLSLPEGVVITGNTPNKIKVKVSFSAIDISKEFSISRVTASNLANFHINDTLPVPIKIICSGPVNAINALDSNDISININFDGRNINSAGTKSIDLSVSDIRVPKEITVLTLVPSSVNLEILSD